ncbi:MAG: autotransporter-associated beta strand repeat-containing protein [Bacteroidales bacterium]|nr:autotransporter-associated beta strand repeat-containing protein [Bacteroidales bacterium]
MILKKTITLLLIAGLTLPALADDIVAFPGAQGWGRFAKGARVSSNPTVYHVTNLNDSGTGSLRDAVSQSNRIVVFDVSGVIRISSRIVFSSNIYVAGQTAPGEGITVYGNGVSFSGASNIICRYLRIRMGHVGDSGKDCAGISSGTNMIFDHCSFSWGLDETFSINPDGKGDLHDITLMNCIFGQGLMTHSAGGLMQADYITLYRNLYIDNSTRNNKVKGINQYANNVVYNWSNGCYIMGGDSEGTSYVNIESNCFINGPSGGGNCFGGANEKFHVYGNDNWQDSNKDGVYNPILVTDYSAATRETVPYDYPELDLYPGNELIERNIPTVGASLPYRDQSDCYMIDELMSFGKKGALISNEENLAIGSPSTWAWWSGTKRTDTDGDGMPDEWEDANGTDKTKADATVKAANGYLNIENYINSITADDRQFFLRRPITLSYTSTSSTITLSWRDYTYAEEGFRVLYKGAGDTEYREAGITDANATSFVIKGLADGQSFDVRVCAFASHNDAEVISEYATAVCKTRPVEVGIIDIDSYEPTVTNSTAVPEGAALLLTTDEELEYTLTSAISPASVVATGKGVITVKGAAIGGTGTTVNKGDEGTLRMLCTTNSYTGATVLHNGVLEFNSIANGGVNSAIGASQEFAQNWIMDGGTYRYVGTSATTNRSARLTNPTTLEITNGKTVTMNGTIEGVGDNQEFTLDGDGQLTVGTTSFFGYTGPTVLKGGTLYLSTVDIAKNGIGSSSKLVMAGGKLATKGESTNYETYSFPMEVEENTTSVFAPNRNCYMKNKLTGAGTLEIQIPYLREYFNCNVTEFTGKLVVNGLNGSDGSLFVAESRFNMPTTQVYLEGAGKTYMCAWSTNADNYVGGISGDAGTYLIGSSKSTKGFTCSWTVGGSNSDETFNGVITNLPAGLNKAYTGTVNITKVGTGLWRLNGTNDYAGTTQVKGGTLIVNGKHTGTASYTVSDEAVLRGTGSIPSAPILIEKGATLAAGDTLVANHKFTIGGYLTVKNGATVEVPVSYYGLAVKSNSFAIGNATLGDDVTLKIDLTNVEGTLPLNSAITVFSTMGTINGKFNSVEPAVPAEGQKWDLTRLYTDGKIYVRDESFNSDDVSYAEASWFDESQIASDGFFWFDADHEAAVNRMIADGDIVFDANGKSSFVPAYTATGSTHNGGLKVNNTNGEIIFRAERKFMSARFSFYRAGTAAMTGSVWASTDGETYTKIGDITGDPKTEVVIDFSEALKGKDYCFLKILDGTSSPLYIQGAAITYEKMFTGLDVIETETAGNAQTYDLSGRKAGRNARGVLIRNGSMRVQY